MARGHADVFPDIDQVFLLDAQQVDALSAGDLDRRNLVLVDRVGDAAQLARIGFAAPHTRDHAVGAILLNVGMAALVDVAALRVVLALLGPGAGDVVVHRWAAAGAAVGRAPLQKTVHIGNGQQLVGADRIAHRLVPQIGAAAHRLELGRGRVVAAGGEHQDLLDQPGARAAAGAGLGVLAHFIEREQAFFLDGLADRALVHAVAAAHFVSVRHGGGLAVAFMAGVADVRFAEHQPVADALDAAAVAQQLEVVAAVHRVAVQAGADQLVVFDDQLFVDAAERVAHDDFLGAVAAGKVAGAEQVDAGDLELGRGQRAGISADAELRQMVGQHLALLKQWRDQAVGDAPVRGAFADGIDARVGGGLQRVAHHDAAVHMQAHGFGQGGIGADANGHADQVGRDFTAVLEAKSGDALAIRAAAADQFLRLCADQKLHAALGQRLLQQLAGRLVQLALHQRGHDMHHGDIHAALHQAVGRLQAEQAAADDHRMLVHQGRVDHGLGVGNVAVGQHALQILAGNRQDERVRAGGHHQPVVLGAKGFPQGIAGVHHAARPVHARHRPAGMQRDAVVRVPGPVVQHDFAQRLLACQHRREQDAVVVGMWLGAKHGDLVKLGRNFQQLFERTHAGHAIANHHQSGFFHRHTPWTVHEHKKTRSGGQIKPASRLHHGTPASCLPGLPWHRAGMRPTGTAPRIKQRVCQVCLCLTSEHFRTVKTGRRRRCPLALAVRMA